MGYKSALIPEIQIPNFITGELFKTTMGQVGYYTFFAVVAYLNLRWIFVLPIIVLEEKPFRTAARKSATLVKESFFKVLFFLVGFFHICRNCFSFMCRNLFTLSVGSI